MDQNLNEIKRSPKYELAKETIERKEPKYEPLKDSYNLTNEIPKQGNELKREATRYTSNEIRREEIQNERPNKYNTQQHIDESYEELNQTNYERHNEIQHTELREYEMEYEDKRCMDASFLAGDKELFGVSEQVAFEETNAIYNTSACPPMMPMYGYGMAGSMSQPMQQPFVGPMPGMPGGFVNPMMSYPMQAMQGPYPVHNFVSPSMQGPELHLKEVQDNSKVINELNDEIKKLQSELKESKLKVESLKVQSASDNNVESRVKELEEKLKRKDMDSKITEDMLRSELDAIKKRNEVPLYTKSIGIEQEETGR